MGPGSGQGTGWGRRRGQHGHKEAAEEAGGGDKGAERRGQGRSHPAGLGVPEEEANSQSLQETVFTR